MDKIGFKNFRRFKDFPAIDLAPITFFVGENNAGKSTVVKGILALSDFFKDTFREDLFFKATEGNTRKDNKEKKLLINMLKKQEFNFSTNYLAHIGTFKRALYNKAENDIIIFNTQIGLQEISIEIIGDRKKEEAVSGMISKIVIDIKSLGLQIIFDLQNDKASVKFYPVTNISEEDLYYINPKNRTKVHRFLNSIVSKEYIFEYKISNYWRKYNPELLEGLFDSLEIALSAIMEYEKTKNHIEEILVGTLTPIQNIEEEKINFLKQYTLSVCQNPKHEEWMFVLPREVRRTRTLFLIDYLYAHAVNQAVIYSAKDTNDYLSKTIHEFASVSKSEKDYRKEFIKKWMKEFNIGVDYSIKSVGGEAHIVKITNEDRSIVNLADKGMGSIQLMVLLFRLAITLPSSQEKEEKKHRLSKGLVPIIIIEEPEQNLHPMLQSKLADLFYKINKKYGYKFIIETHSEYLIRRTQVLVSEMRDSEEEIEKQNPFKVFYFPSEGIPYDMNYLSDGHFEEAFGTGFFDEAGKWTRELARNRRK